MDRSVEAEISRLAHYSDALETECERLRRGLRAIAHADGGWCGDKARETLHPGRYEEDDDPS
jgi:hypothetical protein